MRSASAEARLAASLPVLLLGALVTWGFGACRSLPARDATPAAILASAAQAAAALRFGPAQTYAGERLYDFMDGAAVTYLEHHFRTLAAADVFRGEDQAKIELYELATTGDSERLYAELSASSVAPFGVGEAGCTWAGFEPEALFRRGRFLVRLLGYARDRDAAASLLAEVGAAIDAELRRP